MGSRARRAALPYLCSAAFLSSLAMATLAPILSLHLKSLGASVGQIGLFFTLYSIAWAPMQVFAGYLADAMGRRRVAIAGLLIYGFSSLGILISKSITAATASRVIQGIGLGLFGPSILGIAATFKERGKVFAFFRTSQVVAFAVGPAIGGFLSGLRTSYPFLISLCASLCSIPPVLLLMEGREAQAPSSVSRSILGIAKDRKFVLLAVGTFLAECVFASFEVVIPLFGYLAGWSKWEIGTTMASYFASFVLTQVPIGYVAERIGKERVLLFSSLTSALVSAMMLISNSFYWFCAMMASLGMSLGALFVQSSAKAGDLAPTDRKSLYMAFFDSAIDLSFIAIPGPASLIFGRDPQLLFITWSSLFFLSFASYVAARIP